MLVLGLDPSLTGYGWAAFDSNAVGRFRRIASGHEGTLPSTIPPARFLHFSALVSHLIERFPNIEVVGIESPAYNAGPFQAIHFGLMQFSLASIFQARKDCVLFDPATLKYLAGGGKTSIRNVSKFEMQRFVQLDTIDPQVINHNEADAYVIAYFAARFKQVLNGTLLPSHLTPSETRVFATKVKKKKSVLGVSQKHTAHIFRENSRYFLFSKVPPGRVDLPTKSEIPVNLLEYIESQ